MPGPVGLPVIDTMIGFPHEGSAQYDFIRKQTKDRESKEDIEFPVEYMFKDVPQGLSTDDPVSLVLQQMDRFGIEMAMIGVGEGSAQEALKILEGWRPDVVVSDIGMPGIDGFGVLRELRRDGKFAATPVMALTASAMQGDRERALAVGFDSYISKPIPLPALRQEVERLLAQVNPME